MKFRIAFFSLLVASLFMVACGGGDKSVRDEARQAVTANTAPAAPAMPAATTPSAPAAPAVPTGPLTTLKFAETEFDFGTITSGEKVEHVYKFTNTGSEPLIISDAKGSCGCTVPEWPKEPIAPGATNEILVRFDSSNKSGAQSKRVTLTTNTEPAQNFLTIKGQVNKVEEPAN